ncbi:MAG TPA: dihydrodipicolinate synthase family protein [Gaiellaceae bacterium]|nr:dihydrodipicolinate synthase family protein [Gaiellaceae bacterium]
MSSFWHGVLPAITTPFDESLAVDSSLVAEHCDRMLAAGCAGVIPAGSLGEGATLSADEKLELVRTCAEAVGERGAVVPGIAALSTAEAVSLARGAEQAGATGLMVLPPYAYSTDWREMRAHVRAVIGATGLPCILYNNPVAYGTDFLPEQIAELAAELPNLEAVKESSTDVRRVTELKRLLDDRLAILVGVDDLIVEGVGAGAVGWVAGLVNAFPEEALRLFELSRAGRAAEARELYEWFLPLLRLDTVPKLVQLIKLVQELTGQSPARVRPPRLELTPEERAEVTALVDTALASRPLAGVGGT